MKSIAILIILLSSIFLIVFTEYDKLSNINYIIGVACGIFAFLIALIPDSNKINLNEYEDLRSSLNLPFQSCYTGSKLKDIKICTHLLLGINSITNNSEICGTSITILFSKKMSFQKIEVAARKSWNLSRLMGRCPTSEGNGAKILVSKDVNSYESEDWIEVGRLPEDYSSEITTMDLNIPAPKDNNIIGENEFNSTNVKPNQNNNEFKQIRFEGVNNEKVSIRYLKLLK